MDDTTNYVQIVSAIFGANTSTFRTGPGITNPIIGALNNVAQFGPFHDAFISRLRRLKPVYAPGTKNWDALLIQVNQIATPSNWEGAYSELAAYDFFHFGYKPRVQANLDCYFPFFDAYSDVKSLKDIVEELLQGIYPQVLQQLGISNLPIIAEYPPDIDYGKVRRQRAALVAELTQKIDAKVRPRSISSSVIRGLTYKLQWAPGVLIGSRLLSPTSAAEQYHKLVFGYAKKYTKTWPFVLSLVAFDWYHGVQQDYQGMDREFYRAFARRVFLQYMHSPALFSSVDPDYTGAMTIHDVLKKISAILFLRDRCILSKAPASINVDGYLYINPVADNLLTSSTFYGWLRGYSLKVIDLFDGDIY